MTKKQVLFWRVILIFIVISGGYFMTLKIRGDRSKNIDQIVEIKKSAKDIESKNDDEKVVEKEIELNIRPDDFYKNKKEKH